MEEKVPVQQSASLGLAAAEVAAPRMLIHSFIHLIMPAFIYTHSLSPCNESDPVWKLGIQQYIEYGLCPVGFILSGDER